VEWHVVSFKSHKQFSAHFLDYENFELATIAGALIASCPDYFEVRVLTRMAAPLDAKTEALVQGRADIGFRSKVLIESVAL
jgi:hypothetical protein